MMSGRWFLKTATLEQVEESGFLSFYCRLHGFDNEMFERETVEDETLSFIVTCRSSFQLNSERLSILKVASRES